MMFRDNEIVTAPAPEQAEIAKEMIKALRQIINTVSADGSYDMVRIEAVRELSVFLLSLDER